MIIQLSNIVSGFVLAAPWLKTIGAKEHIEAAQGRLNEFRGTIGLIALVLGVLALLQRMGIFFVYTLYFPLLGASYPQAVAAIAMGLILSANFFEKWPAVRQQIDTLELYGKWIGVIGIAVGLFSLI